MMYSKPKKKLNKQKFIRSIVIFAVVFYVGGLLIYQQVQIAQANKQISAVDLYLAEQKTLQQELEQKEKAVTTPEYIEKMAREQLNFAAPEEIVFVDGSQKN